MSWPATRSISSNQFARALSDKWTAVKISVGHAQAPLIAGALAHFECEPYAHHEGGDHVIFVARVLRYTIQAGVAPPPIFFRGRYRDLDGRDREGAGLAVADALLTSWFTCRGHAA